jgi:hypothetical protein
MSKRVSTAWLSVRASPIVIPSRNAAMKSAAPGGEDVERDVRVGTGQHDVLAPAIQIQVAQGLDILVQRPERAGRKDRPHQADGRVEKQARAR